MENSRHIKKAKESEKESRVKMLLVFAFTLIHLCYSEVFPELFTLVENEGDNQKKRGGDSRMKRIVCLLMLSLILLGFAQNIQFSHATLDDMLVVYIGAHPDDIDIGMSGSLFKYDVGHHPILWIVVTDGAADMGEYDYEVNSSRGWVSAPYAVNNSWPVPYTYDHFVTRDNMSDSLSSKRCGGDVDGQNGSWTYSAAYHSTSSFGNESDWRTRVSNNVSSTGIEKLQLTYYYLVDALDNDRKPITTKAYEIYPDGSLAKAEASFRVSIAKEIAVAINRFVVDNNYTKSSLAINSHAPYEVANNSREHPDHEITGNAVRLAIDYLIDDYNFTSIGATWYTIYNPIVPRDGSQYSQEIENIENYTAEKSNLCKACWETAWIDSENNNFYWTDYPYDPSDYEYYIGVSYP